MTSELQRAVNDIKPIVEKEEKELEEKTGLSTSIFSLLRYEFQALIDLMVL